MVRNEKYNSSSGILMIYLCKVNITHSGFGVVRASGSTYGRNARANKIFPTWTKYCLIIQNCFTEKFYNIGKVHGEYCLYIGYTHAHTIIQGQK